MLSMNNNVILLNMINLLKSPNETFVKCLNTFFLKFNLFIYLFIYYYIKNLEVNLFAFANANANNANANKSASRIFVYKSSPSSTLPFVIPEYIWIVLFIYFYLFIFKFYFLFIYFFCGGVVFSSNHHMKRRNPHKSDVYGTGDKRRKSEEKLKQQTCHITCSHL